MKIDYFTEFDKIEKFASVIKKQTESLRRKSLNSITSSGSFPLISPSIHNSFFSDDVLENDNLISEFDCIRAKHYKGTIKLIESVTKVFIPCKESSFNKVYALLFFIIISDSISICYI